MDGNSAWTKAGEAGNEAEMPLSPPLPIACSAELRLLAACVLSDDVAVEQALNVPVDWGRFTRLATYNGVQSLAGQRLQLARAPLPPEVKEQLLDAVRQDAVMHLSQTATSVQLVTLLGKVGVSALVLKGAALAQQLYADHPEWRRSSDIDILIDEPDLDAANQALLREGFSRSWPDDEPPLRGRDMFMHLANVFNYVHPETGQLVELHYRITLNPHWMPVPFARLLAESELIETRFGSFRGIAGDPMLSYLCWHALSHGDYRLKWFGDLARALRRAGQTGLAACLLRDSSPLEPNPALLADGTLHALTDGALGARVSEGWRAAAAHVIADMDEAVDTPIKRSLARLPVELANMRFVARLSSNWRGKGYTLTRSLCDPRDVGVLGLSARWVPLYCLAGPFLAVRRFLRGRRAGGEGNRHAE